MILQAFEYEKRENAPKRLQEFFDSTSGKFRNPSVISLVNELNAQREIYEQEPNANATSAEVNQNRSS